MKRLNRFPIRKKYQCLLAIFLIIFLILVILAVVRYLRIEREPIIKQIPNTSYIRKWEEDLVYNAYYQIENCPRDLEKLKELILDYCENYKVPAEDLENNTKGEITGYSFYFYRTSRSMPKDWDPLVSGDEMEDHVYDCIGHVYWKKGDTKKNYWVARKTRKGEVTQELEFRNDTEENASQEDR